MNDRLNATDRKRNLLNFHPSAFLFAVQLGFLIVYAAFDGIHSGRAVISAFSVVVLALVVWVVNRSPTANWVAWALAIPALIMTILSIASTMPSLLVWSYLLELILYFYTAVSLIIYMMGDQRVTTDELFAIGATFTLLAWGFAYSYLVCQVLSPGSLIKGTDSTTTLTFIEMLSLSFTNLTATGLSDILPNNPWSRLLIMLTQFAGIGYVSVVVSRLIGLTLQQKKK